MVKSKENLIGAYAFLLGIVLAVIIGFVWKDLGDATRDYSYIALVMIGLVVGILNVGDKDSRTFLLASVSLVIVAGQGQSVLKYIQSINAIAAINDILTALIVLFIPATIIVAIKTVFSITKV